jgi:phosphate transport system permease protein
MSDEALTISRIATPSASASIRNDLRPPLLRAARERLVEVPLVLAALVSIFTTVGIVAVLAFETYQFFTVVPLWQFVTDTQ